MNLTKLYAYEVFPQKGQVEIPQPAGGKLQVPDGLRDALNHLLVETRLEKETAIAFHVDDPKASHRRNAVREAVMQFAFGKSATEASVADQLALRLAAVTDNRSTPFLLFITGFKAPNASRVILWAFPKDQVFKFSSDNGGPTVEVVSDVFSVSSKLRKAALFEGTNSADSFWEGRMLDLQSGATELWVEHFLACRLSLSESFRTQRLADYISAAYRKCDDPNAREQLFNAVVGVRTLPMKRVSFHKFANDYLSDTAKDLFLAMVPSDERSMSFDFDRETFEAKLGFRVFKMKDDVYLSSPFGAIGTTVQITNDHLKYEGEIEQDTIRKSKLIR